MEWTKQCETFPLPHFSISSILGPWPHLHTCYSCQNDHIPPKSSQLSKAWSICLIPTDCTCSPNPVTPGTMLRQTAHLIGNGPSANPLGVRDHQGFFLFSRHSLRIVFSFSFGISKIGSCGVCWEKRLCICSLWDFIVSWWAYLPTANASAVKEGLYTDEELIA